MQRIHGTWRQSVPEIIEQARGSPDGSALADCIGKDCAPAARVAASAARRIGIAMIGSIIVGLLAGWLAGQIIRGDGYGVLADILLGLVGGVVGGWMFAVVGLHANHMLGSLIVSTIGASALVMATRAIRHEL
jgi:uncharacterized membrane protein YeaQ/YmgE (transglycosylase-associated protein family)